MLVTLSHHDIKSSDEPSRKYGSKGGILER